MTPEFWKKRIQESSDYLTKCHYIFEFSSEERKRLVIDSATHQLSYYWKKLRESLYERRDVPCLAGEAG